MAGWSRSDPAATGVVQRTVTTAGCYHCGEALAARAVHAEIEAVERHFCCIGCRAAAQWLHQSGLADYYTLRTTATGRVDDSVAFAEWDSAGFKHLYVREVDGHSECDLSIANVRCAACAWLIGRVAQQMPGVQSITVDPATASAQLCFDPERTPLSAIAQQFAAIGYTPSVVSHSADVSASRRQSLKRLAVAGLGAMQAMMFTEALYFGADELGNGTRDFFRVIAAVITTIVVFYAGAPFFRGAWHEVRLRQPGMDLMVAISVGLAYAVSLVETARGGAVVYFDAAVMFVFLLTAARHIEAVARARANERLQLRLGAEHQRAERVAADGSVQVVALSELACGDQVRVASGESVAVDGVLIDRLAQVDESLLTGESRPVSKQAGDTVLAGSIALDTPFQIEVSAIGAATRVGQLRTLVRSALMRATGSTESGARSAAAFTIAMLAIATASGLIWSIFAPERALPAVLAVLAAACPCAFALAIPLSRAVTHAMLAQRGVIVTTPDALARAATIDRIVIDKTGTLTEGRLRLGDVELLDPAFDRDEVLAIAAALERGHRHPIASALREYDSGVAVGDARLVVGQGVSGVIAGQSWRLGQAVWLQQSESAGVILANAQGSVARLQFEDRLRPQARTAVANWRRFGSIEMLSGDAEAAVTGVADTLGITACSRMTPAQKCAHLRDLQAQGHHVLMLGDGLNDVESLAAANIGIAMGGGSALTQCHADVVLLRDDLSLVGLLIDSARRTQRITRQNMAWAIGYHVLLLPFAISGLMPPWLAALGMSASSLVVVLNALRLGRSANPTIPTTDSSWREVPA